MSLHMKTILELLQKINLFMASVILWGTIIIGTNFNLWILQNTGDIRRDSFLLIYSLFFHLLLVTGVCTQLQSSHILVEVLTLVCTVPKTVHLIKSLGVSSNTIYVHCGMQGGARNWDSSSSLATMIKAGILTLSYPGLVPNPLNIFIYIPPIPSIFLKNSAFINQHWMHLPCL